MMTLDSVQYSHRRDAPGVSLLPLAILWCSASPSETRDTDSN